MVSAGAAARPQEDGAGAAAEPCPGVHRAAVAPQGLPHASKVRMTQEHHVACFDINYVMHHHIKHFDGIYFATSLVVFMKFVLSGFHLLGICRLGTSTKFFVSALSRRKYAADKVGSRITIVNRWATPSAWRSWSPPHIRLTPTTG